MRDPFDTLVPGALVRHPEAEEWGLGQVQSVIGNRVTVNFENEGKVVINGAVIALEVVDDPD
ncbi:MAG: DUF3553 domain-containing protein [Alphaproteobacteria bacterium]|jgi:hypothetical protein|nr:DUF3553 domain-containing protein [Alphaproteobacteria bacterium]